MSSLSETTGYITLFHLHTEAMSSLSETTGYITLLHLHTEAMSSLSEITGCITLPHMHTEAMKSLPANLPGLGPDVTHTHTHRDDPHARENRKGLQPWSRRITSATL